MIGSHMLDNTGSQYKKAVCSVCLGFAIVAIFIYGAFNWGMHGMGGVLVLSSIGILLALMGLCFSKTHKILWVIALLLSAVPYLAFFIIRE
jgi:hypothetical protein